ncbi:MAG: transposase [Aestuariivita sp.]|nr:transposase [Aestuariivita sp.]
MNMDQTVLTDNMWERMAPLLSGKATGLRRTADHRLFLEVVLWRFCTRSPWQCLPAVSPVGAKGSFGAHFKHLIGGFRCVCRIGG